MLGDMAVGRRPWTHFVGAWRLSKATRVAPHERFLLLWRPEEHPAVVEAG